MKKKIVVASSIVALMSIIAGCGGSSNNDDTTNNNTQTGTAYYVDNAVAGVSYQCGNQKGTTENDGKFIFEKGADCEFSLAGIPLREVPKDDLADGKKIVENNIEVAQLLQSLDADGDLTNGIQITPEIVEAVKKVVAELNVTKPTAVISNENLKEELISEVAQQVPEAKVELKPKEEVVKHLEKTLTEVTTELIAGKTFYIAGMEDGEINFFKVKVNSDATQITSTNLLTKETKRDKIKIDGNKIYFLDENDDGYFTVSQTNDYILLENKETELRAYLNETDAKKYYDSLIEANAITADKIKAAFANKTIYRVKKYLDGTTKLVVVSTTDTEIDYKAYINNTLDTEESGKVEYTIEGDTIIIKEDNETDSLKVTAITDKYIVILDTEDNDVETWYYSKTDALKHPEIRNHNYENEDNGEGGQADTPKNKSLVNTLAGKTFYVYDNETNTVYKLTINNDATSWTYEGILGNNDSGTEPLQITEDTLIIHHPDESEADSYKVLVLTNSIKLVNKNDNSILTLYYNEDNAKAAYKEAQTLYTLLAGKTFYLVDEDDNLLDKISFNEDLTSATLVGLEGQDKGDTFTLNMQTKENKIIFEDTPDKYRTIYYNPDYSTEYMVVETYDKNNNLIEKAKLFFDENKAREYYNSLH